jgi:hypothetical protein
LRRKSEPDIDPKRPGNTENYYMAGVIGEDGKEGVPTSTRRFGLNKAGVPNPKGGRKPKPVVEEAQKMSQMLHHLLKDSYQGGYKEKQ